MGGLPSVKFDGAATNGDFMEYIGFPTSNSMSFFVVANISSVDSAIDSLLAIVGGNDFQLTSGNTAEEYKFLAQAYGLHANFGGSVDYVGDTHIFGYTLDNDSKLVKIFVDGVEIASTPYLNVFNTDGNLRIGSNRNTVYTVGADISEVIILKSVLSDEDRQSVEEYLIDKWDINN